MKPYPWFDSVILVIFIRLKSKHSMWWPHESQHTCPRCCSTQGGLWVNSWPSCDVCLEECAQIPAVWWCMPGVCANPGRLGMYAWRSVHHHQANIPGKMLSILRARHESPRSVLPSRLRQRIRWREGKLKNGRQLTRWRAGQWCACSKLCVCLIQAVNLFVFIAAWSKLFLCLSS